jgi:hypothetical protein
MGRFGVSVASDPKVEQLQNPLPIHHDVFWLDVAVDDAGTVRAGESRAQVLNDRQAKRKL